MKFIILLIFLAILMVVALDADMEIRQEAKVNLTTACDWGRI